MGSIQNNVKKILPRSLFGRSLMIIVTPLVLLQIVAGTIFYESHWDKVSLSLARGVAGDIAAVISLMRQFPAPENNEWIFGVAAGNMGLSVRIRHDEILPNEPPHGDSQMEQMLIGALQERVGKPFQIDTITLEKYVVVRVQLSEGVLEIITPRKRLFSSTVYVFVLWMVGTSLILFGVATIFMRNQVKPIRRLAIAADNLGKGREVSRFKPEGAKEVRQAASAFLAMRERILRQIGQRTEMLAGVSHDLRTPLTRMRLQLEMAGDGDGIEEMKTDVAEMEHMLESYLAFARGEGTEPPALTNLNSLLDEIAAKARRKGGAVDLHCEEDFDMPLRPNAIKRAITNLVDNALHYASHVAIQVGRRKDIIEIIIDDDGHGIPEDKREDVFKPFFRLESSRNPVTGGTGLGLAIARDVVRGHGGDIELDDAPGGGLRVRVRLPL
jgi:two-component system, OmpR family, osmolarity sensor histidine kinase EnvZ